MSRINNNRFSALPLVEKKASSWKQPNKHLTTIKCGDIVPVYVNEVLPGDNINMVINKAFARMTTPIFPVMDSAYLDIYWFYVPFRILYDLFPSFLGANDEEYGIQENEYFLPSVRNITYTKNDIASYMGLPIYKKIGSADNNSESINTMYFKAYAKIVNEYFRDENLTPAYEVKKTYENFNYEDNVQSLSLVSYLQYGKTIAKASKLHDLFTSALPFTQKGPSVSFNFDDNLGLQYDKSKYSNSDIPLTTKGSGGEEGALRLYGSIGGDNVPYALSPQARDDFGDLEGVNVRKYTQSYSNFAEIAPVRIHLAGVGVSPSITFSVNDLRTAFQMQRFYELLARSGTRYNEFIKGVFGVDILDATIQRPELLASKRFTINMSQVVQTSSTDSSSPQGNTSGISATMCINDRAFNKSFTESGILMGLVVVRTNHTYTNRLPKEFSKKRKFDFYYPVFANLGEQPILNKEIYFSDDEEKNNQVFGYQEAWYEYRYKPSFVSGEFATENDSYSAWTYADYYEDTPILNETFIKEPTENISRTLAVEDGAQFIIDFYCEPVMTRLMPLYSIPGLIDHL